MNNAPFQKISTSDKVILLLALVPYLLENGATSVATLSKHFAVAESDLRDLVLFLSTAGIPGETLTYQPDDLFDINWQAYEEEDLVELVKTIAVDSTPRFSGAETAALMAGLQTLSGMLDPELQQSLASLQQKLARATTDFGETSLTGTDRSDTPAVLDPLATAIQTGKRVTFEYRDRQGSVTLREVDPHLLKQLADSWYLKGFCHIRQDERVFKAESISNLQITDTHVEYQAPEDVEFKFEITGLIRVDIAYDSQISHLIDGWQPQITGQDSSGRLLASVGLVHDSLILDLIAIAPGQVEVIAPKSQREWVATWANDSLNRT